MLSAESTLCKEWPLPLQANSCVHCRNCNFSLARSTEHGT